MDLQEREHAPEHYDGQHVADSWVLTTMRPRWNSESLVVESHLVGGVWLGIRKRREP